MKNHSRITSILQATTLNQAVTGIPAFKPSFLNLPEVETFSIPNNLRLGHLIERIFSQLIRQSTNYTVLHENIQLKEHKTTIGELDFILQETETNKVIHLELAYKFYLLDPSISEDTFYNWIGPNRNDSLAQKVEKLKQKQFPLLFHPSAKARYEPIAANEISQHLCLLASLFVPYQYESELDPDYQKAIKGYYIDFESFFNQNHSEKQYYIPQKKEWGLDPSSNENWSSFDKILPDLKTHLKEQQAPMIWSKHKASYQEFFVVWW